MGPLGQKAAGETVSGYSWAGAGLGAFGTMYAASSQAKGLKAQSRELERQAKATKEAGIWQQVRFNEDTRRLLSTQRELFGEAGVALEGAPLDLMSRTKSERVQDRMQLARNTEYQVDSLLADAKELRRAAHRTTVGGVTGAFSSFF